MSNDRPDSGATAPTSEYDLVLALVPALFLAGVAASVATGHSLRAGVTAGSLLASLPVGYGLFGSPPRPRNGGRRPRANA